MNLPIASHPERSGASGTSRAQSKDPAHLRVRSSKSAGTFASNLVAEVPSIALRMTRGCGGVHSPPDAGNLSAQADGELLSTLPSKPTRGFPQRRSSGIGKFREWVFDKAGRLGFYPGPANAGKPTQFFVMATTEVILTHKIANLGAEADVVKVRRGYARNYLVPQGKALEITPATLKRLNLLKAKRAEREANELNEAGDIARRINKLKISMDLETGETGKAFGSITAADIAEKLKAELGGLEIDRHKIHLDKPIKESGAHEVVIKLHHDVNAKLTVNVKARGADDAPAAEEPVEEKGFKARPKAKHSK